MAHEHRVSGHLGVEPDEYDRTIRTFIPQYDRMLGTIVHWLQANVPAGGYVVELGTGTGALAAAILDALPEVRMQLVDADPNMLEAAATRCAAHPGRFDLRHGRFQEDLPRCNAVVATLALHHVADDVEKGTLYHAIHEALEPGGLLVAGDLLIHPEGAERRQMLRDWYAHMAANGITEVEADGHFGQWAAEDRYLALVQELELIRAGGFPRPDCFWRDGGLAVYGAFKDE